MCNLYDLDDDLRRVWSEGIEELRRGVVLPPGVTPETSNMVIPRTVYPRRDGLFLRPVTAEAPDEGLEPVVGHWNLTPFFHRAGLKAWKASTNNARSETMATSPAFREAFKRRRCIIPATSWTEWTGPKGTKTKHRISRADGKLLWFAGMWDRCPTDDGWVDSYTMVMIDAAGEDDVAPFHTRQPVCLTADTVTTWLDLTGDPTPIYRAPPPKWLVADPPDPVPA